jgi:hypothetical protein
MHAVQMLLHALQPWHTTLLQELAGGEVVLPLAGGAGAVYPAVV